MALDATRLAAAIQTKMLAKGTGAVAGTALSGLCASIAEAVIEELTANAVITPNGVPPLSNGGGAVVGTGKVT